MGVILKVMTIQSPVIKILAEALKDLVSDINLIFTRKVETVNDKGEKSVTGGIGAVTMAMANNVLMHLKLNADSFDYYECNRDKFVAGINTNILFKVMKTINPNDTITFFVDEDDSNKLGIRFENKEKNIVSTKKINLMDIDEYKIDIPPSQFTTCVNMPSNYFNKICRDLNSLADTVEIKNANQQLILTATGESVSDEIKIGESENGVNILTEEGYKNTIFQGKYDIKYLCVFAKCTGLCANVEIFIKNDYPLVIRYCVASLGTIYLCLSSKTDPNSLKYDSISESDSDSDSEDYSD